MGYNTWGYGGPHEPETYERKETPMPSVNEVNRAVGSGQRPSMADVKTATASAPGLGIPGIFNIIGQAHMVRDRAAQELELAIDLIARLTGKEPPPVERLDLVENAGPMVLLHSILVSTSVLQDRTCQVIHLAIQSVFAPDKTPPPQLGSEGRPHG